MLLNALGPRRVPRLEQLEPRLMLSATAEFRALRFSPKDSSDPLASSWAIEHRMPPLSATQVLNLQSKPGSNYTIYLDFDGQITTGTDWNAFFNVDPIISPAFDLDGDTSSFSQTELQRILISWQRTAEDFAPFDVNVTTRDPGIDALINSGGGDTQWGARAIVTVDNFAACGCGGFAFLNSFGDSVGTPTFIFNLGEDSLGETFSHEVGHMLGLNHDGLDAGGQEYYRGHGTGPLSWGAIMGAPFTQNITQWDRGEYFDASNPFENDLQIITTQNGFTYRPDDYGNTRPAAADLSISNTTSVNTFGIIETNTDLDYFRFETGAGNVSLDVSPLASRPNVDLWAGLYSSTGALVAQANPGAIQSASLSNIPVSAGTYFLRVEGIGSHDTYQAGTDTLVPPAAPAPWTVSPPSGYSNYGSLGQYTVSGTIVAPGANLFSISATDAVMPEGNSGQRAFTFTVTRSGNTATAASVNYALAKTLPAAVGDSYPSLATSSDFAAGTTFSGLLSFAANEVSKALTFQVLGDMVQELDESFDIVLSSPSAGWRFGTSRATGTIQGDENAMGFSSLITTRSAQEGPFSGTLIRWRQSGAANGAFDEWGLDNVALTNSTFADDFDPGIDFSNWSLISTGTANANFVGGTGNALFVTGSADRRVVSRVLNPQPGDTLSFSLIFGNGSNGGENADPGEDVVLEYSLNDGDSWTEIAVYDTEDYTSWTNLQAILPPGINTNPPASLRFTVERDGGAALPVTVNWVVDTAGLSNPASPNDFVGGVLPNGQLSFLAGESAKEIVVSLQGDANVEPDERFTVRLTSAASGGTATIDATRGTVAGTIVNDDTQQPGDFNGDGEFDCVDVDALVANIASQSGNSLYDLTNDGQLSLADLDRWLILAGAASLPSGNPFLLGDANLDGTVDGSDFILWNSNKFTNGNGWCGGDFNADGVTDGSDFILWNTNKFTSSLANRRIDTPPTASLAARDQLFAQPVQHDVRQPSDIGLSAIRSDRPTVARAISRGLIAASGVARKPDARPGLARVIPANYS